MVVDASAAAAPREVTPEAMARLRSVVERTRPVERTGRRLLPLTGATEHLLPGGGLTRGSVVQVCGAAGATTLALALVAGPGRTGSWVACVGFPQLGWQAAEEVGLPLDRLVAVRVPATQTTTVVAALVDAFDVVLCGPEVRPGAAELRNLQARARERESVLLGVAGDAADALGGSAGRRWPSSDAVLSVEGSRWQGLGEGWGRLGRRCLSVLVEGRGELSRPRREEVWIDPEGHPVLPGATAAPRAGRDHGPRGASLGRAG